jgi:hypothetical protein
MKVQSYFPDVFHYAYSAEAWVKNYFKEVGFECDHTFVSDLCIADWYGEESGVIDTYNKFIKDWGSDYKVFTEIVMCVNLLSWFNEQLTRQEFEGREKWTDFYTDLYYKARDSFYDRFNDNDEACDWYFKCTD